MNGGNPFDVGLAKEYFVGREEQLAEFEDNLQGLRQGRPRHVYVPGLSGSGKTSFLDRLVAISAGSDFLAGLVTLSNTTAPDPHVRHILKALVSKVDGAVASAELLQDWNESSTEFRYPHVTVGEPDSDAMKDDLKTLERYMDTKSIAGVVLCIDEGQRLPPVVLSALKNALQHCSHFLVVVSLLLITDPGGALAAGRAALDRKAREAGSDYGASRLFATGLPIGPFKDDSEAARCITRRLVGNPIQFTGEVIQRIVDIEKCLPYDMIVFADAIYKKAKLLQASQVSEDILGEPFAQTHTAAMAGAATVVSEASRIARVAIAALISVAGPATADQLVKTLYPGSANDAQEAACEIIQAELDRLCETAPLCCVKQDGQYALGDAAHSYALKLQLGQAG
jgi:hypothetical protein